MKKFMPLFFLLIACTSFSQQKNSQRVYNTSNGSYTISYYAENIIKLTFTPGGYTKNQKISDAVILKPKAIQPSIKVNVNGDLVSFNGKSILINIDSADGYFNFNFALETNEKIFGGGERALPLNRRGYRFNLYNNPWYGYGVGADNLNYSVPFFTSSKGYGLFFDNPSKGIADIGKTDENIFKVSFSSGELNVYVILGNDYEQVLQSYHKLTGTQPIPPRWAFGNLMSRFGYTSDIQARDILAKMQKEKIPVDAIIFDLFWFGDSIKGTLGNLDWINKNKWPDPKKMISSFKSKGVNTILVTEPFFVETSKNYIASKPYLAVDSSGKPYYLTDFYFGKGGLIDIFRKDAKDWFWNFYKKQMDIGVEAWWGDLGEPEKHPSNLYHNLKDYGYKKLFAANEVHNIYGHTWTKMLFQKYAQVYPNKRLFSLNRSGFAGSQRYSIFPWTGDVSRSWSGLQAQLPILLGMSMSGVPYAHSDAGGFAGGQGDKELYVRWLQFAVFTPIFRPHGTALYEVEPAAFSFPSEAALIDTPWRNYAKAAIELRYKFLPYNYTLGFQQQKYGAALIQPLFMQFPQDTNTYKIEDQFMWGANVMVAPVLEKNALLRKIYLPLSDWYRYSNLSYIQTENALPDFPMSAINGNSWITDTVSITDIPVFIRGGTFLAQNKKIVNTSGYTGKEMTVIYFPSIVSTGNYVYEDDGRTKDSYQKKLFQNISFECEGWGSTVKIKVNSKENYNYQGKSLIRNIELIIVSQPQDFKSITVNGVKLNEKKNSANKYYSWNKKNETVTINFPFDGKPLEIKIVTNANDPAFRIR